MQVHYFQRYHSKENVTTANTMLMLSRLYKYSSDKFFSMLNDFILNINQDKSPEIKFELQKASSKSVPDAVLTQRSFKIVIETKLYNQFYIEQLQNHLTEFQNEDIQLLLTLDPNPIDTRLQTQLATTILEYNQINKNHIYHRHITFENLIEAMESIIDDRDIDMLSILEDFKNYCINDNLIPDSYKWLRAVAVGTTLIDNQELNLVYEKESSNVSKHGYIGLYNNKCIKAIGELYKTIVAKEENGKLICESEDPISIEEEERIKEAIIRATKYNYDLSNCSHRYFMVKKFYPTNFIKRSKNGILKSKFFDLEELFPNQELPSAAEIANKLNGKEWE